MSEHEGSGAPAPLRTRDVEIVVLGCAVWAVLLVIALLRRDDLIADGRGWWIWTCLYGIVLGFVGLGLIVRRRRLGL